MSSGPKGPFTPSWTKIASGLVRWASSIMRYPSVARSTVWPAAWNTDENAISSGRSHTTMVEEDISQMSIGRPSGGLEALFDEALADGDRHGLGPVVRS